MSHLSIDTRVEHAKQDFKYRWLRGRIPQLKFNESGADERSSPVVNNPSLLSQICMCNIWYQVMMVWTDEKSLLNTDDCYAMWIVNFDALEVPVKIKLKLLRYLLDDCYWFYYPIHDFKSCILHHAFQQAQNDGTYKNCEHCGFTDRTYIFETLD